MKISFLASHGGTAARNLIDAVGRGVLGANVGPVVTNNRESLIHHWCTDNGIEVIHIGSKTHPVDRERDLAIAEVLTKADTELVVLSGYMKKLGPTTLRHFQNRILNVHPALLPKFGGRGMFGDRVHEAVLACKETVSGATVHLVNAEYDEGPILAQETVVIQPGETVASLRGKIHALEGPLLQKVITNMKRDA